MPTLDERKWVLILMRKIGPGYGKATRPVPFGPYTHTEMMDVLEKELITVREDEYLEKATLRTLGA